MKNEDKRQGSAGEDDPQVFKPEKEEGGWTFSRRDFLRLAIAATTGAVVASLPGVKDLLGRRVQVMAHSTELTQPDLQPGQVLTKIWYLKNNADQPWGEGAMLSLSGAAVWGAVSSIKLPNLAPGQVTPVRVPMVAPAALDPHALEATVALANDEFKLFLPMIHKSPIEPPCTCESYVPCTCDSDIPCTCDDDIPCSCDVFVCPCDYEVPCVCDVYICPCDYEVPCVCDVFVCPCDYDVPCVCDYDIPCSCDYYIPCGCVYYFP